MNSAQLKQTRLSLNLTQEELALSLGMAPVYATTISKMERGVKPVSSTVVEGIKTII